MSSHIDLIDIDLIFVRDKATKRTRELKPPPSYTLISDYRFSSQHPKRKASYQEKIFSWSYLRLATKIQRDFEEIG